MPHFVGEKPPQQLVLRTEQESRDMASPTTHHRSLYKAMKAESPHYVGTYWIDKE
jgi:hypothetical protein